MSEPLTRPCAWCGGWHAPGSTYDDICSLDLALTRLYVLAIHRPMRRWLAGGR